MSGSADLYKNLRNPYSVYVKTNSDYMGAWSDSYMVNGAVRECHPDFIATPIGSSPYGFLVCQRKKDPVTGLSPEEQSTFPALADLKDTNYVPYKKLETNSGAFYSQSYDMYKNIPNSKPRNTFLGGQALRFTDRRPPYEATLQGSDYYRDCIKFRGIGTEPIDRFPGEFGYDENKYYYSAPPPIYDITQGVQPYSMWRREQVRMGTVSPKELGEFEKISTFAENQSTF